MTLRIAASIAAIGYLVGAWLAFTVPIPDTASDLAIVAIRGVGLASACMALSCAYLVGRSTKDARESISNAFIAKRLFIEGPDVLPAAGIRFEGENVIVFANPPEDA